MNPMQAMWIFVWLCLAPCAAIRAHQASAMVPNETSTDTAVRAVAKTLNEVEKRWFGWAVAMVDCGPFSGAANCTSNSTDSKEEFKKSCDKVSQTIIDSNAGDKTKVQAYMSDVCGQDALKGQPAELCLDYSQLMVDSMSEDQNENIEAAKNSSKMCMELLQRGYLGQYASKEEDRLKEIVTERDAAKKRQTEEVDAVEQQVEADVKAAVARQHLESAANATKVVTQKREEAVRSAVAAQRKAEEVEQAEEVRHRLEAEAQKAQEEADAMSSSLKHSANSTTQGSGLFHKGREGNGTNGTLSLAVTAVRKSFLAAFPVTFS